MVAIKDQFIKAMNYREYIHKDPLQHTYVENVPLRRELYNILCRIARHQHEQNTEPRMII
jgi:hypothetical protein